MHELPLRLDVKQSAGDFLVAFVVTRSPWPATISDVPGRGDGKGRPVMEGWCREKEEDGEGLYGRGARLKFLHTNGWKPKKQAKEERVRRKNRREGGNLSQTGVRACLRLDLTRFNLTRRSTAQRARYTDVPRSMIDRYDWGPSNLQLVARHVRIITQHASPPLLSYPLFLISVKGCTFAIALIG